jgi:hypothetical protein
VGKLQIDQLASGMVLSSAVTGRNNRLLLAAGVELTDGHLTILRTWGIQEVEVEGAGDDSGEIADSLPAEISAEQLEQAKAELLPFFKHTDLQQPAMSELLKLAAIRKVLHG